MTTRLEKFKAEMSPLTVYVGIVLVALLGIWSLLQLSGQVQVKTTAVFDAKTELHELNNLQSENVWAHRLRQSEALKAEANMTLWQGATDGIIAATLQQRLRSIAQSASITILSIKTDPIAEIIDGQKVLTFELIGDAPIGINPAYIIEPLAAEPRTILVQDLSFRLDPKGARPSRFTISGKIPIFTVDSLTKEAED